MVLGSVRLFPQIPRNLGHILAQDCRWCRGVYQDHDFVADFVIGITFVKLVDSGLVVGPDDGVDAAAFVLKPL